jgi:hypothetical protein
MGWLLFGSRLFGSARPANVLFGRSIVLTHEVGPLVGSPCLVAWGSRMLLALAGWFVHTNGLSGRCEAVVHRIGPSFDGGPEGD